MSMTTKPAYEQLTKDACVSRLRHGLPLTIEQQRWLAEQIWGPIGTKKKRCPQCNADRTIVCIRYCDGDGYVCAKCNGTQGTRTQPCLCASYEHSGY